MNDLKVSFCDIPARAVSSVASTENANFPHLNLFVGSKTLHWESAANVTSSTITLDLGLGNTASIDHAILSGLEAILAQSPGTLNAEIRASTDNFASSNVLVFSKSNITGNDLIGSYGEELLLEGLESGSYRYWRQVITTSNAVIHKLRKLYLGLYFDFGARSPSYPYSIASTANSSKKGFISDAGTTFITSSGRDKRSYEFQYLAITDDVREEFYEKIGQYVSDYPVFLVMPIDFEHRLFKDRIFYGWLDHSYASNSNWKDVGNFQIKIYEDILG